MKTRYFKNCTVTEDKKYSRSYGNKYSYSVSFIKTQEGSKWIELFTSSGGSLGKKDKTAKHFHAWAGIEITERTFNLRTKKQQAINAEYHKKYELDQKEKAEAYKKSLAEKFESLKTDFPEMIADIESGKVTINTSCKGSRGTAFYLVTKYNTMSKGVTFEQIRSIIRENYKHLSV
jgi:hypothetical protein